MKMQHIEGRLRRAWSIARQQGASALAHDLAERARERLVRPSPDRLAFLLNKAAVDAQFDLDHGVDTGGIQRLYDLTIDSPNAAYGVNHVAVDPEEFDRAIESLDIDVSDAAFVDLGAGKGRALILAAAHPFRALIGVEFAKELYRAGLYNLARAATYLRAPDRLHLHHADAADFALPEGPLVLFLYNPFDAPVMSQVVGNASRTLAADPRAMRVVYVNPVHLDIWTQNGWTVVAREQAFAVLAPEQH